MGSATESREPAPIDRLNEVPLSREPVNIPKDAEGLGWDHQGALARLEIGHPPPSLSCVHLPRAAGFARQSPDFYLGLVLLRHAPSHFVKRANLLSIDMEPTGARVSADMSCWGSGPGGVGQVLVSKVLHFGHDLPGHSANPPKSN